MKEKRSKPIFRFMAGIMVACILLAFVTMCRLLLDGYFKAVLVLILAISWLPDFAMFALRGDGVWLLRADRYTKETKSQNNTSEHISEGRERPSENAQR